MKTTSKKERLGREYESLIGYNPFVDEPTISESEVESTLREYRAEVYRQALQRAVAMLEASSELEVRSALKQAGADLEIPYGDAMGAFVEWAEKQLGH